MCYYNGIRVAKGEYAKLMKEDILLAKYDRPLQSGFSYENWPVILDKKAKTVSELAHWEFIPFWYKSMEEVEASRKKYTTLNAKGETLLTSRIYKEAARERRCLVLSSGFYEWRHYKGKAYPYHIKVKGKDLFYMAGVWQGWTDKETGERLDTFALITTEANELMTQVHTNKKRMPTILTDETAEAWMSPDISEREIKKIATYHTTDLLEAQTIRKDFRTADDPMEPYEYEELPPLKLT